MKRLRRLLALPEEQRFLLLAILIGLGSGLAVVCFRLAIDSTRILLLGSALAPSAVRLLVVPPLAGLAVGVLVLRVFPLVRGSGVQQTKAAVYVHDGYIPFSTVVGKFIVCALSIGSGQSLGPEDPSLQMGAGIASALGRRLRLSRERIRLIAPVGAAAGLAAAFNAPISAVLFIVEEVLGSWSAGGLGAIVLAACSSVVVARWFLGEAPLFRVPPYRLTSPPELLAYAALGVAGGAGGLLFVRLIRRLRPRVALLPRGAQYFLPAAAGLALGLVGLAFPQVLGAGYEVIDQAMHDQYPWKVLGLLAALKMLATTASFVSGVPGGLFAPTLFVGAMLGGAVGGLEHLLVPSLPLSVGSYALVGMGTLFAAFLRVPMTSVFMVLEVSGDYSIILPVMISNTIAYVISRRYESLALFDLLSQQEGVDLPSMEERREEQILRVEDAMRPYLAPVLEEGESAREAMGKAESGSASYLLVRGRGGWGGLRLESLRRSSETSGGGTTVERLLADRSLPVLYPDQTLDVALRVIRELPLLPVVNRADPRRLEGVLSRTEILRAYQSAGAWGGSSEGDASP